MRSSKKTTNKKNSDIEPIAVLKLSTATRKRQNCYIHL